MRTLGSIPTWATLWFIGTGNLWQVMCSRSFTTSGLCWPWKRGQKAEAGALTWVPGGGAGSHPLPSWLQPCCCSQGAAGCLTTSFLPTRAPVPFLGRCFSFSPGLSCCMGLLYPMGLWMPLLTSWHVDSLSAHSPPPCLAAAVQWLHCPTFAEGTKPVSLFHCCQ